MSWTASLDDEPPAPVPSREPAGPGPNAVLKVVGLLLVLGLVAVLVPRLTGTEEPPPPEPVVLGERLAVAMKLPVPLGTTVTSDTGYVGLQLPGSGSMLVTVPDEVTAGRGLRAPMPDDPATWLRSRSDVYVSRVRQISVGRHRATQVDYRRSNAAQPQGRFARISLFCSTEACTQITSGARVRATFLEVAGRTVLVEAVWPAGPDPWTRNRPMPTDLRHAYDTLLTGAVG